MNSANIFQLVLGVALIGLGVAEFLFHRGRFSWGLSDERLVATLRRNPLGKVGGPAIVVFGLCLIAGVALDAL